MDCWIQKSTTVAERVTKERVTKERVTKKGYPQQAFERVLTWHLIHDSARPKRTRDITRAALAMILRTEDRFTIWAGGNLLEKL